MRFINKTLYEYQIYKKMHFSVKNKIIVNYNLADPFKYLVCIWTVWKLHPTVWRAAGEFYSIVLNSLTYEI